MSRVTLKKFILLFGDLTVLYLVLFLTLTLRYKQLPQRQLFFDHLQPFTIIFLGWLVIFYIANLYDLRGAVNNSQFWRRTLTAITFAGLFATLTFYILSEDIAPKTNLAIYMGLFLVAFPVWRQLFNWSIASRLPRLHLGFIGLAPEVSELKRDLTEKKYLGYKVVFELAENDAQLLNLKTLVTSLNVNTIIISTNLHESVALRNTLFDCLPLGVNFINLPNFYESLTGRVPINVINQTWFLENLNEGSTQRFETIKRQFDLILSIISLIISSPFWLLLPLLIKIDNPGSALFTQIRLGKNGKPFTMLKFRTMRQTDNNFSLTVNGDKRITRLGRFLRKTRLDEIPQLINILKGEMSFVGPRPERPEFIMELERAIPFYRERLLVKPGVTGWDQVSGEYHSASTEDTLKKLQYDLFYIKNRSIYLDLSILLKTIYTVLSRAGL
jgi:exopolysaccharide biosynthesis polyprenyl glycosylphosphotransferase